MDAGTWELVRDERSSLADLLMGLTPEQWQTITLCERWRVQDVVAHLVMTPAGQPRPWPMTVALIRARGRLWTAGAQVAIDYARRDPAELLEALRATTASRTKPVFVVADNILVDLVVHGQDIAVPLGMTRPVPDAAAQVVLERVWTMGWSFHARRRLTGIRLQCESDHGRGVVWRGGAGAEVSGPAGPLALAMTGRLEAALPLLRGPGVAELERRRPRAETGDRGAAPRT